MTECTCVECKIKFECNADIKCSDALKQRLHNLTCWCGICVQKASFFPHNQQDAEKLISNCYGHCKNTKEKVQFT